MSTPSVNHANKPHESGNRFSRERLGSGGLFVIGTDTDVGKTHVACRLVRALVQRGMRVGVYKPVASGSSPAGQSDAELLRAAAGTDCDLDWVCPQRFSTPVAPPIAAELEGKAVDEQLLLTGANHWLGRCELLVVESAGGVLSPIAANRTVLDLAVEFAYPLLLVVADRVGAVNHTLLTLEAVQRRGLRVEAIILNQIPQQSQQLAIPIASQPTAHGPSHPSTSDLTTGNFTTGNYDMIRRFAPSISLYLDSQLDHLIDG